MTEIDETVNSAYAVWRREQQAKSVAESELPPDKDEARHVLGIIKAIRKRTNEWFESILENRGVGSFKQDDKRPFNRALLFNRNEAGSVTQIFGPSWLKEIRRCHLPLWSVAEDDKAVGDLLEYVTSFKHEWEEFFQTLSRRFPDAAANLLSDFEYAGMEMFGNLEACVISGNAAVPNAEVNHDVFLDYLPEVKKLFVAEACKKEESENQKGKSRLRPNTVDELLKSLADDEKKIRLTSSSSRSLTMRRRNARNF